jgi:hypothetical protein
MDAVPSGSYLVVCHGASDIDPEAMAAMTRRYNGLSSATFIPRARDQVTRFFAGLDLVPPGVVPVSQWPLSGQGAGQVDTSTGALAGYCAIASKP